MVIKRHQDPAAYYLADREDLRKRLNALLEAAEGVLVSKNVSMLRPEVVEKLEAAVANAKKGRK